MSSPAPSRGIPKLGIIIAVVALLADQLSKYVIVERVMRPDGETRTPYFTDKFIEVLPFLDLRLSWNSGISFSMFNSGEFTCAILLTVQISVTLVLLWWLRSLDRPWLKIACGLVIGGALGNVVDRIQFCAVADFLDFYWADWHFPTFNVADSCISVGAALWLLDAALAHPQSTDQNGAQTGDPAVDNTKD